MAIATIAGIAVAGSPGIAALIGLIFTVQSVQATNTQLKIAEQQQITAEQGQITDRYNAAITNLGSASIEVRLGGIYALQRLMQDSPRDQPTVVAVLCAFVRDQSASITVKSQELLTYRLPTDIQAALTVVGTRNTANDGQTTVVDFDYAHLPNAQLRSLHLSGADFSSATLTGANITHADLSGANLDGAYITGAYLTDTDLTGADLAGANITHADLSGANLAVADLAVANLTGADLTSADLAGAVLSNADLDGVYLDDANLTGAELLFANLDGVSLNSLQLGSAKLTGADLTGAKWSKNVPAPAGWVRDHRSGMLTHVSAGA